MSIFDSVVFPRHKRNVFDLSHEHRTSASFGKLIPILCQEVLPGDTFKINTNVFLRAMPMGAPLMHRVNIYTHFFFVPNRLVWDNWKTFITGGEDGTEEPVFPTVDVARFRDTNRPGSLADHLGVQYQYNTNSVNPNQLRVNALPFRAYNLIWNEYYRDQNLQDEIEISKADGLDTTTPLFLLNRNWEKDYFTSALPWTQRGPSSVMPMGDEAPVILDDLNGLGTQLLIDPTTGNRIKNTYIGSTERGDVTAYDWQVEPDANRALIDPNGTLKADLANAQAPTINDLRRAIALQRWMENNAIGGSRYIEQIFSHFGVKSSDARLQRPEYLGGTRQPLSISEVLQTSASTENSDLGDMAGHGISAGGSRAFRRFFEEHGFIIGIMSVMPKSSYMNGTARVFKKFDKFDYAFPEFANLGEQPVYNFELYTDSDVNGNNLGTFGYQSRYAEYKYIPNTVHGDLKTDHFDPWTLVRKFANLPRLNSEFIEVDNQEDNLGRIFAAEDSDTQFIVQFYHQIKAVRMLPKFVIPTI